jgi:hypothetical protein
MKGVAINPHAALERVLLAGLTPASVMIESDQETPWASATFSGARHYFDMTVSGNDALSAAANLGTMISENRVCIAGHVVADVLLSAHHLVQSSNIPLVVLGIEALTVSE